MTKIDNKHICIVSPSLKTGGIERSMVNLALFFHKKAYQITFISCLKGDRDFEIEKQIPIIEPYFRHSGSISGKFIFYPRLILFIRSRVKKINPDVVLSFGDWFSPMVLLSLLGLKYPVFISDRTSPDYKFRFPIPQLKKWLYPKSAGFIAQTSRAYEFKHKEFGNKLNIRVIPNAVRDVALYPEISREKIILYVGRFAWEKGPERLIKAFRSISDKQGWQLHLAGSGPLLNYMKQLAIELDISDHVTFYGKVKEVDQLYAKASIFVLPSILEGFPNALCEAMAAGLPCVCFDKIPYEDIFTNGVDGIAIIDGDLDKLRDTLIELMENKFLREHLGMRAKEIRFRLSLESIGGEITKFIFEK